MLNQLVRGVEHGRIRNQQGPSVAGVMSAITTPTPKGPVLSHPLRPGHLTLPAQDERGPLRTSQACFMRWLGEE